MSQPEISLYLLAKQAKADGKPRLVWAYAKDHARRMRAYFAKEKATAATVTDPLELTWD